MQRTRVRGALIANPATFKERTRTWNAQKNKWNDWVLSAPINFTILTGTSETITDVYRPAPANRRDFADVLPVVHESLSYRPWKAGEIVNDGTTLQRQAVVSGPGGSASHHLPPRRPKSLDSLPHREAIDQFNAGGVATGMSLLNFIAELGEIKGLLKLVSPSRIKQVFEGAKLAVADQLAHEVSGGFLAYSFGIRPLIQDISAIAAYSESLTKRLGWLLDNKGKTVSLDFRKSLVSGFTTGPPPPGFSGHYTQWLSYSATYHAFCRWKVQYDPVAQAFEKLKYFNRYFGTSKLLSVAWEALPYSFLLDWVSNLSGLVLNLELPEALNNGITASGYSVKELSEAKDWSMHKGQVYWEPAHVVWKRYERYPGIPTSFQTTMDLTTVSGRQLALAFALAHQKMGRAYFHL